MLWLVGVKLFQLTYSGIIWYEKPHMLFSIVRNISICKITSNQTVVVEKVL